jgi:succinate dehydrogenase/fumarate reductase-like Fe-S protein
MIKCKFCDEIINQHEINLNFNGPVLWKAINHFNLNHDSHDTDHLTIVEQYQKLMDSFVYY